MFQQPLFFKLFSKSAALKARLISHIFNALFLHKAHQNPNQCLETSTNTYYIM
ncbi:hypothetical protein HHE06_01270 [Helicobacter heilmannii]|uniref:Uncharacterized protein n=1 Tax=Helicobacter heilmannii TaxID=35817 RepID=A0A0K2YA44_HELHE|nr:hypothetical protein BN341_9060 [Helicobacter heilmannii ASB1.4]CRF50305.1 hypothetical protein HHE06_01270 [Helicobacter heilmannii]CRI35062.1 hypothetical protein HHE01_00600 [Helicobacter heilmannii]